jgi:hypothetical protein
MRRFGGRETSAASAPNASSTKAARIMITLLNVGSVRLITLRESLFPIPASSDGAAQRAGGTPTQRIASPSAFSRRLFAAVKLDARL